MINRFRLLVIAALSVAFTTSVQAGPILQDQSNGGLQILAHSPIGQTFTAEDAQIQSIGVFVGDANSHVAPSDYSLDMTLRTGGGAASGTTLLTVSNNTLSDGFNGWLDFDFSGVNLIVGDLYNFQVSNENARWFLSRHQHSFGSGYENLGPDYAGGHMFIGGSISTIQDLKFRVNVAVPAPAGAALFGLGLMLLGFKRKNRSST